MTHRIPLIVGILGLLVATAWGYDYDPKFTAKYAGPYLDAQPVKMVDGDTFDVEVYPEPRHKVLYRIRLMAAGSTLDTPEVRRAPRCEKILAAKATAFSADWLFQGRVTIGRGKFDSFGRFLATVTRGGEDLGTLLMNAGLARPWRRGNKEPWC